MGLVSELRRRNVFRMAVLYVVAAWLVMQVAEVVIGLANLPEWVGPVILAVLAVGFPIALLFSWIYELTPEGLALEKDVPDGASITHVTGRRMDFIVIAILAAGLLVFAYDKWWPDKPIGPSIAVLAFSNLTGDTALDFLSDGIAEEVLSRLAGVQPLKVISRTSSFSFRGSQLTVSEIASRLSVSHVLEGSVRNSTDGVRVTVQLIDARSDSHLWSTSYDRNLSNIVQIPDEISEKVAGSIAPRLTDALPTRPIENSDAFTHFLRARHLLRDQSEDALREAEIEIQKAIDLDPNVARYWDTLSTVYQNQHSGGLADGPESLNRIQAATATALELDPTYAPALQDLGALASERGSLQEAADYYQDALKYASKGDAIYGNCASFLRDLGRIEEAIEVMREYLDRDPLNPVAWYNLSLYYLSARDFESARDAILKTLELSPDFAGGPYVLGLVQLYSNDADGALRIFESESDEFLRLTGQAIAYFRLGNRPNSDTALSKFRDKWGSTWPTDVAKIYSFRGETDEAFGWLERDPDLALGMAEAQFDILFDNIRQDERWNQMLASIGLAPQDLAEIEFDVGLPN